MINKFFLFVLFLGLISCGAEDNSEPPAELVDFEASVEIEKIWSASVGSGVEQQYLKLFPLMLDQQMIVADREGEVSALSLEDGDEIWSIDLDVVISGGVGGNQNIHFVTTRDGEIIAFDNTGKVKWRERISSEVLVPAVVEDDLVILRSVDGQISALSIATGKEKWVFKRDVPALTLRGNSQPIVKYGRIYCGLDSGRLVVLDASNGRTIYDVAIAVPKGRSELERVVDIDGDADFYDGQLFMASYQGRVVAIDVRRGQLIWSRNMSTSTGVSVASNGLFSTDARDFLWALDKQNGATLWKQEKLKARQLTKPVAMGDMLVVGDYDGYLHWISQYDGRFIARVDMDDAGILVPPVVKGNTLYAFSREGAIAAYRLKQE